MSEKTKTLGIPGQVAKCSKCPEEVYICDSSRTKDGVLEDISGFDALCVSCFVSSFKDQDYEVAELNDTQIKEVHTILSSK